MQLLRQLSKITSWRFVFQIITVLLALVILVPQFRSFVGSPVQFDHVEPYWLLVAASAAMASNIPAAMAYVVLIRPRLGFGRTLVVQAATSFSNRLLPAGIGGMGTFVRYLQKKRIPSSKSAVIVGANQLIGLLSYSMLVVFVAVVMNDSYAWKFISMKQLLLISLLVTCIWIAVLLAQIRSAKFRKKVHHSLRQLYRSIARLASRPTNSLWALCATLSMTLCYVVCLYASLRAVGVVLAPLQVLAVYLAGSAANAVAPTPGGLGPVEAALTAALSAFGVAPNLAVTGVIVYRATSFWLPIVPGYIAFRWLVSKKAL